MKKTVYRIEITPLIFGKYYDSLISVYKNKKLIHSNQITSGNQESAWDVLENLMFVFNDKENGRRRSQ